MRVLLLSDDRQLAQDITFCLQVRYPEVSVIPTADTKNAMQIAETDSLDLIAIDSSLANLDTLTVICNIRQFSNVGLLVLSQGQTEVERDNGLEGGADEYVNVPFSPIEFLATVKALLRRTQGLGFNEEQTIKFGDLTVNFATHEVRLGENPVRLTPTEYHLLSVLVHNAGRIVTISTLLETVWGTEYADDYRFVKEYVHRLRAKIEPMADSPTMLVTERGVGYGLVKRQ